MSETDIQAALELTNAGIRHREAGESEAADAIFRDVIDRFPQLVFGWQELAVLRARQGEDEESVQLFRRALEANPNDYLTRMHLATQQAFMGDEGDALETLEEGAPADAEQAERSARMRLVLPFMQAHSKFEGLHAIDAIEKGERYLLPDPLIDVLRQVIAARTPFSLVRLGDGEGAWMRIDEADEAQHAELYEYNRRNILRVWFGNDALYGSAFFLAACERVHRAIERASVIGIPYGLRLVHEYAACSPQGVPGCTNIMRWLSPRLETIVGGRFCTQDTHRDLHKRRFFDELFAMPDITVGLVTCHAGLGLTLSRVHGVRTRHVVLVPEEKGFASVIGGLTAIDGVSGIGEPHFPRHYLRAVARLQRVGGDATLWFVAAGYLGKVYCDVIREAGGIALDVGSIADGWAGQVTRPYLASIEGFRL